MYKLKYDFFICNKKVLSKNNIYNGKIVLLNNGVYAIQINGYLFCKNEVVEV